MLPFSVSILPTRPVLFAAFEAAARLQVSERLQRRLLVILPEVSLAAISGYRKHASGTIFPFVRDPTGVEERQLGASTGANCRLHSQCTRGAATFGKGSAGFVSPSLFLYGQYFSG